MSTARNIPDASATDAAPGAELLTPQELLAGSQLVHDIAVPASVLRPDQPSDDALQRVVRLRPLRVATLALISEAARDDASLVPLLIIKESLVAPVLSFEQVRQMHAGLVQFLAAAINRISGLDPGATAVRNASASAIGAAHVQLARLYGWTPAQVAELTPGQMAVYLSNIDAPSGPQPSGSER